MDLCLALVFVFSASFTTLWKFLFVLKQNGVDGHKNRQGLLELRVCLAAVEVLIVRPSRMHDSISGIVS